MKKPLKFFLLSLIGSVLVSCATKEKDTYNPGADWTLVWADEFDGDAINPNNWNHQVLKAGTFNEEWQRYTDSEQNAYVENGNLIINAIHESDKHGLDQYLSLIHI